jgi:two-component system, LuxR family, sensor kinase FixL
LDRADNQEIFAMLQVALRQVRTSRTARRSAIQRHVESSTSRTPTSTDQHSAALAFEQVFAHARDALVVADLASGRILRWNPAAERLFGYSAVEAVGQCVDILMPPAVERVQRERVTHFLRTGDKDVLDARSASGVPAINRNGDELRVQFSMAPLEATGAPARSILLTFCDASCQTRAELNALKADRAQSARADAQRRLARCEELLREAPRELELPVTRARRAAARLARLAADTASPPRRLALLADVVERRTEDVQRTLANVLDTVAIETGTFEIHSERVNLVPLMSRLVAAVRTRAHAHRVKLGAPQGLTAQCDARRIEAVVGDLIERAIRRNPRGCWIDVDLVRPLPGIARIEVRDYGRPASARERDQLTRTGTADRGWFVNRHIVERHGGRLLVEFPREGGNRVIVSLPTHRARGASRSA